MRSEAHSLALRAAARIALSAAALAGCSGAGAAVEEAESSDHGVAANGPTRTGTPGKRRCDAGTGATDAGSGETDAGTTNPAASCDDVLAAAFGDAGGWPGPGSVIGTEALACCEKAIQVNIDDPDTRSPHHWACCASMNWGADISDVVGAACTPWGPPVPPAMKRQVRAASDIRTVV